ncbi:penicillin-binding protein 1B [Alcanivorax marinus]|uniref:Penicillin-binding protein 1B n=1 Tax=Alloalcanivorax marinus TaxID=1177169 RepID=A0A9Q3UMX2_9GAMM|nr:penicillin-binding protein 1B [Alloalcanivorax marinus]MBM7333114.1 penicillin-binding protein 1B [Alloalcanivorax marinus]MCC4310251.1 penicillin-binding protein 1B [Alloalcanivorax marinus]
MAKKAKTSKSSRSSKKRKATRQGRRWWSWRFIGKLAVVLLLLAAAGLIYLDAWVRDRFDSHVWQLPARVYARPVELYPGRVLSRNDMLKLLELMRYRRAAGAPTPGSYSSDGNTLVIHTRGFRDSDGGERAERIRVTLSGDRIRGLSGGGGDDSVARLEPLQIGSIHPGHTEDRVFVPLDRVPPLLVQMLIATEDRDFYDHHGISPRGLARAMVANVKAGGLVQGGSTLTQQLVKNFWLTQDRTLARKLVEMPMAVLLELHYSKEQILEAYLNEVYLGQDGNRAIHGMGLGAQFYFGRPLEELEPHQLATLVALLKGPSYYDPRRNEERAKARRNTVLRVANDEGALSDRDFQRYKERGLEVVPRGASPLYAFPAFIDLVRRQLARDYPPEVLGEDGLRIHSTLDVLAQLASESALRDHLNRIDGSGDRLNGSVVVVAPSQGDVLALVSSRKPRDHGYNRALDASRQIGSLIKPAVVLTALKQPKRYSLATPVPDQPITVPLANGKTWTPQNFSGESHGPVPLLDVLVHSYNQGTVNLGMDLGPGEVVKTLEQLGVRRKIPAYPSILLGSINMTPFEVAMWYQPLATGGFATPLRSITDVLDKDGEPLARYPVETSEVLDSGPAYLTQWAMQQVINSGTGRGARRVLPQDLRVAGKTGTSDQYRDAWFAGFSGNHLAVVWVGRDNNQTAQVTGATGALPVWSQVMAALPQTSLPDTPPPGVENVWMAPSGDKTSGENCRDARQYPMMEASIPTQSDGCGDGGAVRKAGKGVVDWFKGLFD